MKKIKILIVEDEAIIALHLKNLVLRLGDYECASVGIGEDAVEISETMNPDLVFMDINLKGSIDGIEAARQICREKYIPIVFVSAYSDDETIETAKQVNPAGYLTKPIHAHVLQRTLESLLKENFEEEVIETYEVQDAVSYTHLTLPTN